MVRKFEGNELIVASHNEGKVGEIRAMLLGKVEKVTSAAELNLSEPEETEVTFVGNAVLKAKAAAQESGKICLADDSGLAVSGLNGAPGIYSARWAELEDGTRDFNYGMERIEKELGDNPDRDARFVCSMALCWPDGHVESVEGDIKGVLKFPKTGDNGFGYDPIFVPNGHDRSFAEMSADEKKSMSHRANAFELIMQKCFA